MHPAPRVARSSARRVEYPRSFAFDAFSHVPNVKPTSRAGAPTPRARADVGVLVLRYRLPLAASYTAINSDPRGVPRRRIFLLLLIGGSGRRKSYYRLPQTVRDNPHVPSMSASRFFQSFRSLRLVSGVRASGGKFHSAMFGRKVGRGGISGATPRATGELARL